ncbi:PD-(D/E)XK nuclease domain-containing protein [Holdemania sp. Marseille-P2844]|uniref:PD-(D/E)XK nuclease domain-containing protein n=1 Tax=Holdemania sp. Marseille-P2844 TaxID=1852366 RepID=UPI00190ECE05|nr:PD-(D/E)XK nuclease domain-containing protein [Holdemania sp. Marseille-P2844]
MKCANYINENCSPQAFRQSTGSIKIIGEIIKSTTPEIQENLQLLMQGNLVSTYVDTAVIYPEIKRNPYTLYSFLLMAGYLKIVDRQALHDENCICVIAIPNKEIFYVYEKEILSCFADVISPPTAIAIQQAIMEQDVPSLQKHLQDFLRQTSSIYDVSSESFYHGLMLGLYAIMNNRYKITIFNREAGDGRYDIQMKPLNKKMPGILFELKILRG